jgi:hypothetical protein
MQTYNPLNPCVPPHYTHISSKSCSHVPCIVVDCLCQVALPPDAKLTTLSWRLTPGGEEHAILQTHNTTSSPHPPTPPFPTFCDLAAPLCKLHAGHSCDNVASLCLFSVGCTHTHTLCCCWLPLWGCLCHVALRPRVSF